MEALISSTQVKTDDFTLFLPSISVGNVGQLAIDLIISTYGFEKYGTLWDPTIIASVGADPFDEDSNKVCTACELYVSEDLKLVVMQLRSGIEYKLAGMFLKRLKEMIKSRFKEVFILTSAFAYEMHDVNSGSFRYLTNCRVNEFESLKVLPLQTAPGDGFATRLYEILVQGGVKSTVVMKYSSEGDNRPDAVQMLNVLLQVLKIDCVKTIKFPFSWNYVYGNPAPEGLY